MTQPTAKMKYVLSLSVARHLLAQGFRLIDLEPSRKFNGLTFIFEDTQELNDEMHRYSMERKQCTQREARRKEE